MDRETLFDLISAYALGALDERERAEVEARLVDDPEARALLDEYEKLAGALVLAVPVRTAPDHLGADLRQRIASRPSAPAAHPVITPRRTLPLSMRWLLAAAILVLIFGVSWILTHLPRPEDKVVCPETQALYQQIITTPNYLRIALNPGEEFTDISGDLFADPTSNAAILHIRHLPALTEDQAFQLWLAGPGETVSGGLFQRAADDTCIVLPLEYPITEYSGFGVSLEPATGSPNPNGRSGPRVFNVRLGDT